jgi:hypothetical protein
MLENPDPIGPTARIPLGTDLTHADAVAPPSSLEQIPFGRAPDRETGRAETSVASLAQRRS